MIYFKMSININYHLIWFDIYECAVNADQIKSRIKHFDLWIIFLFVKNVKIEVYFLFETMKIKLSSKFESKPKQINFWMLFIEHSGINDPLTIFPFKWQFFRIVSFWIFVVIGQLKICCIAVYRCCSKNPQY